MSFGEVYDFLDNPSGVFVASAALGFTAGFTGEMSKVRDAEDYSDIDTALGGVYGTGLGLVAGRILEADSTDYATLTAGTTAGMATGTYTAAKLKEKYDISHMLELLPK